jgi:hypothetical protein
VQLGAVVLDAEVGVHAADLGLREIAEAIVLDVLAGDESAPDAAACARRDRALDVAERAVAGVGLDALEVEAVAHQDRDRAAERVEPEYRICTDDRNALNRVVGRKSQLTMSPKLSLMRTPF